MIYQDINFPKKTNRPFFYTNFVVSVDGKAQVLKNTKFYWPFGSPKDREVLHELRAHADALIHGKNLAEEFASVTLNSLNKEEFKKMREDFGKVPTLPYYIVTTHPEEFDNLAKTESGPYITGPGLEELTISLNQKGYKNILIEGGPNLLGSFLKAGLMDEIFLTIVPKIFGNKDHSTITLVEGFLFPPDQIPQLELVSVNQIENELFVRYKVLHRIT